MLAEKQAFTIGSIQLECGRSIPVADGYETYGTLNAQKDNAVLVARYFSATSHCAGKYRASDPTPGYWDGLIGPGKAVDTEEFFVISDDGLCNTQAFNPDVITTGPASTDPATSRPYGVHFPVVSTRDMMEVQKKLVESMGIKKLRAIIGVSTGGMVAFQWAVNYPHMLDKFIGVITNAQHPILTSFIVLQQGLRAGRMDPHYNNGDYYDLKEKPVEGLRLAVQMMLTGAYTPAYYEREFARNSCDVEPYQEIHGLAGYEKKLDALVAEKAGQIDLNSWIYTCRMVMNHDIAHGRENLDYALARIKARVLMIPCRQDLLHPWQFNEKTVNRINELGGRAEVYPIDSDFGHMAGILQPELFADRVRDFLEAE